MTKKKKKFERGYLSGRKNGLWINIGINIFVAIGVFLLGLFLNKMQTRNIFSVLAILFVLPIARSLSILSVLYPYRERPSEEAKKAEECIKDRGLLLHAPVFTSREQAMHLDFLALFPGKILGFSELKKEKKRTKSRKKNSEKGKEFLLLHLKNTGRSETILLYEDFSSFLKAFPEKKMTEEEKKDLEALKTSMEYFIV